MSAERLFGSLFIMNALFCGGVASDACLLFVGYNRNDATQLMFQNAEFTAGNICFHCVASNTAVGSRTFIFGIVE